MENQQQAEAKMPLCPSSRPELPNSVVFGVIRGSVEKPRVNYLKQPEPVTKEVIALAEPVTPTEVFRTASPCEESSCQHFDGQDCQLAKRVVDQLPSVSQKLPACSIRNECRWWAQEGSSACFRCPQVITDSYGTSEQWTQVATPTNN
ncbi:MAG: nitrogen fixation protein [Halothece sp. Uz-M2-17]|nr:nitrogen fixation protein [Halothece sp. Uz-M2-17]